MYIVTICTYIAILNKFNLAESAPMWIGTISERAPYVYKERQKRWLFQTFLKVSYNAAMVAFDYFTLYIYIVYIPMMIWLRKGQLWDNENIWCDSRLVVKRKLINQYKCVCRISRTPCCFRQCIYPWWREGRKQSYMKR